MSDKENSGAKGNAADGHPTDGQPAEKRNAQDEFFVAIQAGDREAVEQLLAADSSLAIAQNEHGVPALLWALYHRQQPIADVIAVRRIHDERWLSVHEAAAMGDVLRTREHLNLGNDLAGFSADGFTPLHYAAFFGRREVVPYFLASGVSVSVPAQNASGVHPLHSAAASGSVTICQMLLESGAEVNAQQHGGFTALMSAAMHGNVAMVELLLEHSADVSIRNDDGKTAGDMAEEQGHDEVVKRLEH